MRKEVNIVTTMWSAAPARTRNSRDDPVRLWIRIRAAAAATAFETAGERANSCRGPAHSDCTKQISSPRRLSRPLAGIRILILNSPDCAGRDIDLAAVRVNDPGRAVRPRDHGIAGMPIRRRIDLLESLTVAEGNCARRDHARIGQCRQSRQHGTRKSEQSRPTHGIFPSPQSVLL
jgi:hypothetical protein